MSSVCCARSSVHRGGLHAFSSCHGPMQVLCCPSSTNSSRSTQRLSFCAMPEEAGDRMDQRTCSISTHLLRRWQVIGQKQFMLQAKQSQSSKWHNGKCRAELYEVQARRLFIIWWPLRPSCVIRCIDLLFHLLCSKPLPFDLMDRAAC